MKISFKIWLKSVLCSIFSVFFYLTVKCDWNVVKPLYGYPSSCRIACKSYCVLFSFFVRFYVMDTFWVGGFWRRQYFGEGEFVRAFLSMKWILISSILKKKSEKWRQFHEKMRNEPCERQKKNTTKEEYSLKSFNVHEANIWSQEVEQVSIQLQATSLEG